MRVEHLSLTNFRNYARLEVSLPATQPIVLVGENAQGKTSLLEALYYLATARSPHTTLDRQLIHWRAEDDLIPFARLAGEVQSKAGFHRLELTLVLERGTEASARFKKVVKINGADKRVMDLVGLLAVVLFLPQDLMLVEGAPADRRRFIDNTLCQVDRAYLNALNTYERILPQRNALLRRIADKHAGADELGYWDTQLVEAGSVLIAGRQQFLRELEVEAQQTHLDLTGKRELLTLSYQPSFMPTVEGDGQLSFNTVGLDLHRELDAATIAPQFAARLTEQLREQVERGVTLFGPHRDELRLMLNGRDAGLYGSRGQARTAVMALKLAELAWLTRQIGEPPLLLLDEVIAELDSSRRAWLLDRLPPAAQTLLTTTELDIFPAAFRDRAAIWHIRDGQIVDG
jgi:DNA replication and repair protein RecF